MDKPAGMLMGEAVREEPRVRGTTRTLIFATYGVQRDLRQQEAKTVLTMHTPQSQLAHSKVYTYT